MRPDTPGSLPRLAEYFEVPVEVVFSTEPFQRLGTAVSGA
jgi:hypothetical protein